MLKLAGLCLVFLGCAGTGAGMARGVQRELETAGALLSLVRRIGADVRCYKRPLPQIYADFKEMLPHDFLEGLCCGRVKQAFSYLPDDPTLAAVFLPFFENVGRCSAEECERLVSVCEAEAERLIEEKNEAASSKARVYRSLGLAGGLAAVILLI